MRIRDFTRLVKRLGGVKRAAQKFARSESSIQRWLKKGVPEESKKTVERIEKKSKVKKVVKKSVKKPVKKVVKKPVKKTYTFADIKAAKKQGKKEGAKQQKIYDDKNILKIKRKIRAAKKEAAKQQRIRDYTDISKELQKKAKKAYDRKLQKMKTWSNSRKGKGLTHEEIHEYCEENEIAEDDFWLSYNED